MIRLFRKIRHQRLSEDKYRTYILYAAGELLLVVAVFYLHFRLTTGGTKKSSNKEKWIPEKRTSGL